MLRQIVNSLRRHYDAGSTKAEAVRLVAAEYPNLDRKTALRAYCEGLQMSNVGASTYYHMYGKNDLAVVEFTDTQPFVPQITTDVLRRKLEDTASDAATWYTERTKKVKREDFLAKGRLKDDGKGAVYSYHTEEAALYVGITGYRVKSRLTTPTSPHKEKDWWPVWEYMRFLPLSDRTERETLEYLLILGLMPEFNQKPGFLDFKTFLEQH